ncbi:MAG: PH domain-containing protein [Pseudomonadales bacterium]|nr:PH domain-containing protein [Pseudomonadales bacterium]
MSLDRLEINYGVDQTVLISPQTKEAFLDELQRRQDALRSGE